MTVHLRAHFDGKVIVPDEPLGNPSSIPIDQPLAVQIDLANAANPSSRDARLSALARIADRAVSGINLPADALSRESIYENEP